MSQLLKLMPAFKWSGGFTDSFIYLFFRKYFGENQYLAEELNLTSIPNWEAHFSVQRFIFFLQFSLKFQNEIDTSVKWNMECFLSMANGATEKV